MYPQGRGGGQDAREEVEHVLDRAHDGIGRWKPDCLVTSGSVPNGPKNLWAPIISERRRKVHLRPSLVAALLYALPAGAQTIATQLDSEAAGRSLARLRLCGRLRVDEVKRAQDGFEQAISAE